MNFFFPSPSTRFTFSEVQMGCGGSKEETAEEENRRQRQRQRENMYRADTTATTEGGQIAPQQQQPAARREPSPIPRAASAAPSASAPPGGSVVEGEVIKNLATVNKRSIKFDTDTSFLTFEITSIVCPISFEIHHAVREMIHQGAIVYAPNSPRPAPPVFVVDEECDGVAYGISIDLQGVTLQEKIFDPQFPKQIPAAIVLRYRNPEGYDASEHTNISLHPNVAVVGQRLCIGREVYAVETIFGAEGSAVVETGVAEGALGGDDGIMVGSVIQRQESEIDRDCIICFANKKNTMVLPCRHMCLCSDCGEVLMKQSNCRCPVCRGPIAQLLKMGGHTSL